MSFFKRNIVIENRFKLLFNIFIFGFVFIHNPYLNAFSEINVSAKTGDYENNQILMNIEDYNLGSKLVTEQTGQSSWYGRKFHKRKTASGERFDMYGNTAAHRELPFGTIIKVTKIENGKSALLRVNDRGPFSKKRIIDMSYSPAVDMDAMGVPEVIVESFKPIDDSLFTQDSVYYFGYSPTLPLVCIPSNIVKIVEQSDDFEEALNLYKLMIIQNSGKLVYIFTKNVKAGNEIVNDTKTYYLGVFDPLQTLKFNNEIVEFK